jgi:hypothetical protein
MYGLNKELEYAVKSAGFALTQIDLSIRIIRETKSESYAYTCGRILASNARSVCPELFEPKVSTIQYEPVSENLNPRLVKH